MLSILNGKEKFIRLGAVKTIELNFQRRLLKLLKDKLLPAYIYEFIRPLDSLQPRLYGSPKIYKDSTPIQPILSSSYARLISNLFTCIPLLENIDICAHVLCRSCTPPPHHRVN